jgi:hypothetical protein
LAGDGKGLAWPLRGDGVEASTVAVEHRLLASKLLPALHRNIDISLPFMRPLLIRPHKARVPRDVGGEDRGGAADRGLIEPKIGEHRGRVVKNTGDGFLAEFASVVDAVRCAVEMQRGMAERNAGTPPDKRIEFRVGINLGDVIVEEHDIFGDGVNVAARLEALAEPGGICVSGTVYGQIRATLPYTFEDLGEQNLKNIAGSMRVRLSASAPSGRRGDWAALRVAPSAPGRPSRG